MYMWVSAITAWEVQWTGIPHSPKTDSDSLMKDNRGRSSSVFGLWGSPVHRTPHAVITLTIHYDQQLHTAIIQYIPHQIICFSMKYIIVVLVYQLKALYYLWLALG